jgi:hypothetical protein
MNEENWKGILNSNKSDCQLDILYLKYFNNLKNEIINGPWITPEQNKKFHGGLARFYNTINKQKVSMCFLEAANCLEILCDIDNTKDAWEILKDFDENIKKDEWKIKK